MSSISRGRHTGRRGKWSGRGRGTSKPNAASSVEGQEEASRLRPTHFLALPLNNHQGLISQITAFQKGLFSKVDGLDDNFTSELTPSRALGKGSGATRVKSSLVGGLDSSILIDPRRLHMTLGVMALERDDCSVEERPETTTSTVHQGLPGSYPPIMHMTEGIQPPASSMEPPTSLPAGSLVTPLTQFLPPAPPHTTPSVHSTRKTVSTALSLLNSLKPRISEILDSDKGVKIPLEVMHVLKIEKMTNKMGERRGAGGKKESVSRGEERSEVDEGSSRIDSWPARGDNVEGGKEIGAGVLYVAPEMKNKGVSMDLDKLVQVSDLVHNAFKAAGYLTDRRPLKLHCTILNTSHRKPRFRQPFSYSDILTSDALPLFCGNSNSQLMSMNEGSSHSIIEHEPIVQEDNSSSAFQPDLSPSALQLNSSVTPSNLPPNPQGQPVMKNPQPVSVNLGTFTVEEIQLWVMGSHGPNNEYVSCGGVVLE